MQVDFSPYNLQMYGYLYDPFFLIQNVFEVLSKCGIFIRYKGCTLIGPNKKPITLKYESYVSELELYDILIAEDRYSSLRLFEHVMDRLNQARKQVADSFNGTTETSKLYTGRNRLIYLYFLKHGDMVERYTTFKSMTFEKEEELHKLLMI